MQKYYIYSDVTITEEPYDFMSDDYFVLEAENEDDAYKQAEEIKACKVAKARKDAEERFSIFKKKKK